MPKNESEFQETLKRIKENDHALVELDLSDQEISSVDMAKLAPLISDNRTITNFNFSNNNLDISTALILVGALNDRISCLEDEIEYGDPTIIRFRNPGAGSGTNVAKAARHFHKKHGSRQL